MKIHRRKASGKKVTENMIIRSVASSTAIETGESVKVIEARLKDRKSKFNHLRIA